MVVPGGTSKVKDGLNEGHGKGPEGTFVDKSGNSALILLSLSSISFYKIFPLFLTHKGPTRNMRPLVTLQRKEQQGYYNSIVINLSF